MQIIKQSTYETCLPCSLLMILEKGSADEIEIWKHGWEFNYLLGQLNYVSSKYRKDFAVYVENKYYCNELQKSAEKSVALIHEKIDVTLIQKLLEESELIIYLDNYYLQGIVHVPHFVVVIKKVNDHLEIADPYDGKIKMISVKVVSKAISSLRNHLKYSPVLIRMLDNR